MQIGRVRSVHRYAVKSMVGEQLDRTQVGVDGLPGDRAFALRDDRAGEIRGAKRWPRLLQCSARYQAEPSATRTPAATITLPNGAETRSDDPAASQLLSEWLGVAVTLCAKRPASDKDHYRRVQPGASVAGMLARSPALRKLVARLATLGPGGAELRSDFGREAGEPLPDLSVFPAELFEYVSPLGTYFDAYPIHVVTTATLDALREKAPSTDWNVQRFRPNFVVETNAELRGCIELGWAGRILRVGEARFLCTVPAPRCSMVMQAQPGVAKDPSVLRTIVKEPSQALGVYARVLSEGRVATGDPVVLE